MKLKLTRDEVYQILINTVAKDYSLHFNTVETNSGYNYLNSVELSFVSPEQADLPLES